MRESEHFPDAETCQFGMEELADLPEAFVRVYVCMQGQSVEQMTTQRVFHEEIFLTIANTL